MSGKQEDETSQSEIIEVWSKQIESYSHYQASSQRFIGILSTVIAILVSFAIGILSFQDIRSVFSEDIPFGTLASNLPIDALSLYAGWILTNFLSMALVILAILFFYDAFQIQNAVWVVEPPKPGQSSNRDGELQQDGNKVQILNAIQDNSELLDEMRDKIVAGNNQAKRALLSLVFAVIIVFYSLKPDMNQLFIALFASGYGIYLARKYDSMRNLTDDRLPESTMEISTLILVVGTIALCFSVATLIVWTLGYLDLMPPIVRIFLN